ncbi:hypothetical protein F5X71_05400 [Nocardia brasiliensis]|uniref:WXG100 family type VII secretion target n=1 Tax=Nocardia brasiliensis TaxID=37326 RepID=A0A6G9XLN4_NOCBR|nr:hypothetical protein [Nocardia brasiliensis]QIS01826.1 hypothetical protein F5X71_05400 [Nocardia brasiliensis]
MSDNNPYPNLGFNPVPGAPADVTGLRTQINTSADAVRETNGLLTRLRNSNDNVWKGAAGDAFRANFDATLAQDLGYAQKSLERAVGLLDEWHTDLVGFQDTAKGLEAEAADARGQHTQAVAALHSARSNPDLGLATVTFTDPAELQAAQSRLDAATAQVRAASTAVDNSQAKIDSVLRRARDLQGLHDTTARRIASELDAAAKDFAPSPPDKSVWDRIADAVKGIGTWISEHRQQIHDILSGISALTGLLALVTPPPADVIFAGIALVSGAGALAMDALDPEIRSAFSDVVHGDFNSDALKKIGTTVGLDSLAVIPGVGGAFKGAKAFSEIGEFGPAVRAFTEGAQAPTISSKALNSIPRPAEATFWLEDFSQASKAAPGTALAGIELFSRSAKSALGLEKIGSVIGNHE